MMAEAGSSAGTMNVFLSHNGLDWANSLSKELEKHNVESIQYPSDTSSAAMDAFRKGLLNCDFVLLLMTTDYVNALFDRQSSSHKAELLMRMNRAEDSMQATLLDILHYAGLHKFADRLVHPPPHGIGLSRLQEVEHLGDKLFSSEPVFMKVAEINKFRRTCSEWSRLST
eukprot:gene31059-7153_t